MHFDYKGELKTTIALHFSSFTRSLPLINYLKNEKYLAVLIKLKGNLPYLI